MGTIHKRSIRLVTKEFHIRFWHFLSFMSGSEKRYFESSDFIKFLEAQKGSARIEQSLLFPQSDRKYDSLAETGKDRISIADLLKEYVDLGILNRIRSTEKYLIRWKNLPENFFDSVDDSRGTWEKILGLYFRHEPAFRRVLAILLDFPSKRSTSVKHIGESASVSVPSADHIARLLTYAGMLEVLQDEEEDSALRLLIVNSKNMQHFKKLLIEQFLEDTNITHFPEIFTMNLWGVYQRLQCSRNGGKVPIPDIQDKLCDISELESGFFCRMLIFCWRIYPETLTMYRITGSIAKRFDKNPIYVHGIPYFFISMRKPFDLSNCRTDKFQTTLIEYF